MNSDHQLDNLTKCKNRTELGAVSSDTQRPLSVDGVQIVLTDQTEDNKPIGFSSGGSSKAELEKETNRPVDNISSTVKGEASGIRMRRMGFVAANHSELTKMRVLRKKLGEYVEGEEPQTLVKKL